MTCVKNPLRVCCTFQRQQELIRHSTRAGFSGVYLSYINLGYFVCVCVCDCVCVCVSQFVAERSAILLVLAIKLIKETRWRVWRGRD